MITQEDLFQKILDPASRANPYPLYAQLRETPVARQRDGSYVVSTYQEILALLHDPRVSSDPHERPPLPGSSPSPSPEERAPSFIATDPPTHDRLRRQAMRQFGPPHSPGRVDSMRDDLLQIVTRLLDQLRGRLQFDIVDDFAYPFPVTVICELLGVPREDEPRFHAWADAIVASLDPGLDPSQRESVDQAFADMDRYMGELIDARRTHPASDLLSGLITDVGSEGAMSRDEIVTTARLLLIAGHETTVNLITNGMLTLLRNPEMLGRLRRESELVVPLVEELLRFEPPVHIIPERATLDDIEIAGSTIPKGSRLFLMLAAGSRDPKRFRDPDRFIPDREDNQHLGFGSGIHNCFGAPLAREEVQIALTELAQRPQNPRLLVDPPPYRPNPSLRGPRHLMVEVDAVS
jgi:cytochrome P450